MKQLLEKPHQVKILQVLLEIFHCKNGQISLLHPTIVSTDTYLDGKLVKTSLRCPIKVNLTVDVNICATDGSGPDFLKYCKSKILFKNLTKRSI